MDLAWVSWVIDWWLLVSLQLVWPVLLAEVLLRPQLIFPSKTWFFEIYLYFQQQKKFYISHILNPNLTK
jgi:hypothetical protein